MTTVTTQEQVSAGGVVFRRQAGQVEVALISVGDAGRWQLPKGLVDAGEAPEAAAQREVREETGLETQRLGLIETIEYWYYGKARAGKRFHKFVHFYLFQATGGDLTQHDHEVNEARWVNHPQALEMLSFANEKKVVTKAQAMLQALP